MRIETVGAVRAFVVDGDLLHARSGEDVFRSTARVDAIRTIDPKPPSRERGHDLRAHLVSTRMDGGTDPRAPHGPDGVHTALHHAGH
jgi:hypothetical protein